MSAPTDSLQTRLLRRRQELGASEGQLAAWSGLSPDRIREIEKGSTLDWSELDAMCRGLAVDSGAMARGKEVSPKRSVARFRSASQAIPAAEDLRTLALAAELGRVGGFLAARLGRQIWLSQVRAPQPLQDRETPWRAGYRLGEAARHQMGPGTGPIAELEVLLESKGIHVAWVSFSSKIEAASLWETDSLPLILINRESLRSRSSLSRRSLLAHELCHLLHDSGHRDIMTQLSWQEGSGNFTERVEQRARAFAPAFLAPPEEVRHYFRVGHGRRLREPERKVSALARRWGLSIPGATWHAKNCQVIRSGTAECLLAEDDGNHPWAAEFETETRRSSSPAPASGLLADLVDAAVAEGIISRARGQEIVSWA